MITIKSIHIRLCHNVWIMSGVKVRLFVLPGYMICTLWRFDRIKKLSSLLPIYPFISCLSIYLPSRMINAHFEIFMIVTFSLRASVVFADYLWYSWYQLYHNLHRNKHQIRLRHFLFQLYNLFIRKLRKPQI